MSSHRSLFAGALALGLLVGSGCVRDDLSADGRAPDVFLIVADTLRADHLGLYGYERDTAPNLAALAEDALVFDNAVAQAPWTIPSLFQLMTGRHQSGGAIPPGEPTLAEVFARAGYATFAVVDNPIIESADTGLERGFADFYANDVLDPSLSGQHQKTKMPAEVLTRQVERWLDGAAPDVPVFGWIHYFDPHDPYAPPFTADLPFAREQRGNTSWTGDIHESFLVKTGQPERPFAEADRQHLIDLYDAEIHYLDRSIGDLLDTLRRSGRYDRSLIVFTSDHGEDLGERGTWGHPRSLFESQIRVPLLIKLPSVGEVPRRIAEPAQLVDVMGTVCRIARIECPPDAMRRDLITGAPAPAFSMWADLVAVREERFKLVSDEGRGRARLYDLAADPGETADVSAAHPEAARRLGAARRQWMDSLERGYEERARESRRQQEALEALGYVE